MSVGLCCACVLEQVAVAKVKKSREDRNDAMVAWLNEILWVRGPQRRLVWQLQPWL